MPASSIPPRCFGYLRVSDEQQAGEKHTSIAHQKAAEEALADSLGKPVDEWFVDAGASGATAERRPEFMRLYASCQANRRPRQDPGFILVLNDSRFGRFGDMDEAAHWRFEFKKLGWIVRYCESDDIADKTARAFVRLASSAQAHEYRRNIVENARRGSRGTAAQGFWVASAPFGYRREVVYPADRARVLANGVPKAKDEKIRLTPHAAEAAIVRDIFARYAAPGETLGSLLGWLRDVAPGRKWSVAAVRWLLGNRAYVGDVVIGRRMADDDDPGRTVIRPAGERWGRDNAHDAIIDRDQFRVVGAKLAENRAAPRRARSDYALTGVLTCLACGAPYVGGSTKPNGRGGRTFAYRCSGALRHPPTCVTVGGVARHLIEPVVIEMIADTLLQPSVRRLIIAEVDAALADLANPPAADVSLLRAEARARERQERLAAAIADGTLTAHEASGQMATVRDEIARIESAKANEKFLAARRATVLQERDQIIAQVLDAPARLRAANGPALRAQVAIWCKSLTYDRTRRTVRMEMRTAMPAITASRAADACQDNSQQIVTREVAVPGRGARKARGAR